MIEFNEQGLPLAHAEPPPQPPAQPVETRAPAFDDAFRLALSETVRETIELTVKNVVEQLPAPQVQVDVHVPERPARQRKVVRDEKGMIVAVEEVDEH